MTALADQADMSLGAATLRPSTCQLIQGGEALIVEPQVMRVLIELGREPGKVLSREELVRRCWGGRSISEDAINRVISLIRRLATNTGAFQLRTIRTVGYQLEIAGAAGVAPSPGAQSSTPPAARRRGRLLAGVAAAVILAGGVGALVWRVTASAPASASAGPTLAVRPLAPGSEVDRALAAEVDEQLRSTLSRMQGLRLIEAPGGDGRTDLVVEGSAARVGGHPLIKLTLRDGHSGVRIWSANFDGATTPEPTAQARAVSSTARYLAIRLGDGLAGQAAAREPDNPEVDRIVAEARRTFAAANEARHSRQWARSQALMKAVDQASGEALALDPNAARALMLRYQINAAPRYPMPGESQAAFKTRLNTAASYLSRAVAADPDDPEVLVAAGEDLRSAMRWGDAERLLERAVALDPNSPDANTWYAYHLGLMGRCELGLKHARIAAGLMPGDTWRQLAIPRLLHCAGRRAEAAAAYRDLLKRDRGNVFLLRELYLIHLGERDVGALRALQAFAQTDLWRGAPPPPVAAMIARIGLGADAVEGRPRAFVRLLDSDREALAHPPPGLTNFGRTRGDALFVLALEYAEAGQGDPAILTLREAVEQGSLYLPWALPHGPTEFPSVLRDRPDYAALWKSSPPLADLMARRKSAARKDAL